MIKEESIRGAGEPLPPSLPKPGGWRPSLEKPSPPTPTLRSPQCLPPFPYKGQGRVTLVPSWVVWTPFCPFHISTFPAGPVLSVGRAMLLQLCFRGPGSVPGELVTVRTLFVPSEKPMGLVPLRWVAPQGEFLITLPFSDLVFSASTKSSAFARKLNWDSCPLGPSALTVAQALHAADR